MRTSNRHFTERRKYHCCTVILYTMGNIRHPRRGSLQYWPRKRAASSVARIRSWANEHKVKPLGFIGYKAGMTHLLITDNRPKSPTKGEQVMLASTIIDCPPMTVMGIAFYTLIPSGWKKTTTILAQKFDKHLDKKIPLPKKTLPTLDSVTNYDDLRLLVHSHPEHIPGGTKKPKIMEIVLGGNKTEKLQYAKIVLGKEIVITDLFESGNQIDVHGITKGKGFQGTVKRFGVPIRQHKAEKTKRGIGTLGSWSPKRVEYSVAQSGKMGFHLRTEFNKQILKIGTQGKEVTPSGGIIKYGIVNNTYLLVKGSVTGPHKRPVLLTPPIRPNPKMHKEAPEITHISLGN